MITFVAVRKSLADGSGPEERATHAFEGERCSAERVRQFQAMAVDSEDDAHREG